MHPNEARPTELHSLHFDLAHVDQNHDFDMHISLQRYPLQRHDGASRARARAAQPFLRAVPDAHLTHYIDIALPSDTIALIHVTRPIPIGSDTPDHLVLMSIHVPRAGHAAAAAQARASNTKLWDVHPKLARFGLIGEAPPVVDPQFPDGINDYQDATDAATALLFHHPSLVNLNTDQGGAVPSTILNWIGNALSSTGDLPEAILNAGDSWMTTVPAVGPDGQPLKNAQGQTVYTYSVDPDVQSATPGALAIAIASTKNDPSLEGQQWTLQYGVTTASYGGRATSQNGSVEHPALSGARPLRLEDDAVSWALTNLTPGSGLSIDSSLSYSPPTENGSYTGTGIWADNDATEPLDAASITALLAGNLYLKIVTPDHPEGLLRGQLVATPAPVAGQPVNFTATLSGTTMVPAVTTTASGSATFNLNAIQSGLTYNITATGLGTQAAAAFGIGSATESGTDKRQVTIADQSGYGTLTVNATNHWLRHLSACVKFEYEDGTIITPVNWSDHVADGLRHSFEPDANVKYLKAVPPVTTVFGVPIPANATTIEIPVPADAQVIKLYFGGLGRGSYDTAVCPIGLTLTVVVEMALPIILLTAGAAVLNSKPVVAMLADTQTLMAVCTVAGFLVAGGTATYIATSGEPKEAIKEVAEKLGPLLLSPALALGRWMISQISEAAAEKAIPFFNIASTVINAAVTAAQLIETTVEVLDSPFYYEAEITRTIDLQVTIHPDPNYHRFPDQSTTFLVRVTYDKGATVPDETFTLSGAPPWSDPFVVTFQGIPAGGNLKVFVFFYAEDGWQAGQGESLWFAARGTSGSTLELDLEITPARASHYGSPHAVRPARPWSSISKLPRISCPSARGRSTSTFRKSPTTLHKAAITGNRRLRRPRRSPRFRLIRTTRSISCSELRSHKGPHRWRMRMKRPV